MSCPDWQSLAAQRDHGSGEVPGWQAALDHLESCKACEAEALAADPTLLFRRLPVLEADTQEIEAMQRAVRMRRREAVEPASGRRSWLRAAAVAAVLLGGAWLTARVTLAPESPASLQGTVAEQGVESPSAFGSATFESSALENEVTPASILPLVENLDPAYGPIIQVDDQEISVVVVMPQNHDVRTDRDA
ncbi:MAG: hypothetical protein AAF657_10970 [Acidobacteriota bacterium]